MHKTHEWQIGRIRVRVAVDGGLNDPFEVGVLQASTGHYHFGSFNRTDIADLITILQDALVEEPVEVDL